LPAAARRLRAQEVDGATVGLGQQVRAQRAPLGIEAIGCVPEAQEDLLHDLLGQRRVAQQPSGEGEDRARVPAVRLGQRLLPPPADGHDERGVAGLPEIAQVHSMACSAPPGATDAHARFRLISIAYCAVSCYSTLMRRSLPLVLVSVAALALLHATGGLLT